MQLIRGTRIHEITFFLFLQSDRGVSSRSNVHSNTYTCIHNREPFPFLRGQKDRGAEKLALPYLVTSVFANRKDCIPGRDTLYPGYTRYRRLILKRDQRSGRHMRTKILRVRLIKRLPSEFGEPRRNSFIF